MKYNVYRDGEKVGEVAYNAALTTYQYTDTGLTSGEAYAYSVSAESANGEGPACEAVTIRPNGLAGQPTQIGGETTGASSAYVTWTAPSQINGVKPNGEDLEVTGYVVSGRVSGSEEVAGSATLYVKEQGGVYIPVTAGGEPAVQNADGVYELVLSPGTSGKGQVVFSLDPNQDYTYKYNIPTGLLQGTNYDVRVRAVTEAGEGVENRKLMRTWTTPSAPTQLKVTPDKESGHLYVEWGASNPNGTPVTQYIISVYLKADYEAGRLTPVANGEMPVDGSTLSTRWARMSRETM